MVNKNLESEIGVQHEDLKSKTDSHWLSHWICSSLLEPVYNYNSKTSFRLFWFSFSENFLMNIVIVFIIWSTLTKLYLSISFWFILIYENLSMSPDVGLERITVTWIVWDSVSLLMQFPYSPVVQFFLDSCNILLLNLLSMRFLYLRFFKTENGFFIQYNLILHIPVPNSFMILPSSSPTQTQILTFSIERTNRHLNI